MFSLMSLLTCIRKLLAPILEWYISNISDDFHDFPYSLQAKLLDKAL
jgi:hypothetical protein